jgi:hypothetical protein
MVALNAAPTRIENIATTRSVLETGLGSLRSNIARDNRYALRYTVASDDLSSCNSGRNISQLKPLSFLEKSHCSIAYHLHSASETVSTHHHTSTCTNSSHSQARQPVRHHHHNHVQLNNATQRRELQVLHQLHQTPKPHKLAQS